jgi:acetyl-CoA acetyltransferase
VAAVRVGEQAAIVGIGQTPFARRLDAPELQLGCEAIVAALADCGIDPAEVDALTSYTMQDANDFEVARSVGFGDLRFFAQVGYGGGAGCGTVGLLAMAIATGQASVGVAYRARKRGSGARPWATTAERIADQWKWTRPYGLVRPADETSLAARRYLHEVGATRTDLAQVALAQRAHANRNPRAQMVDRPMTLDDYLDARPISEPLCLYDNCLETDGAVACVVVSAERARDLPHPPAVIHAFAQGLEREHHQMVNIHKPDPLRGPGHVIAAQLWDGSDIGPHDLDCAQIYDAFSPLVPWSLEAYGICAPGDGLRFAADGALGPGGAFPVNTSGGSLSEAYVHGFNLITEGVRQIRGTSTSQVPDARAVLVTSAEEVPCGALVLRGDRGR